MILDDVESVHVASSLLVEVGQHRSEAAQEHAEEDADPHQHGEHGKPALFHVHRPHVAVPLVQK